MTANVADRVIDNGITVLDTEATHVYICSAEPTTYTEASSTYALGTKNWGAGGAFGAPAAGTNGRKVTSTAITDGSVTGSGTATKWAVTDNTNSRLLADGDLASSQAVTSGNTWALPAFDITIKSQ